MLLGFVIRAKTSFLTSKNNLLELGGGDNVEIVAFLEIGFGGRGGGEGGSKRLPRWFGANAEYMNVNGYALTQGP